MLNTFPFSVLIGCVLGFLAGLGVGGGSLLLLWLTLMLHMAQSTAAGINLLFFLPAAFISCILRLKQGKLKLRPILPAAVAGALSAAVFTGIGTALNTEILKKPFGALLLLIGICELLYRPRKTR